MKNRHQQKLVVISIILLLALNMPLVLLFDNADNFLGFPFVYVYIFSIWVISVVFSFIIVKRYNE